MLDRQAAEAIEKAAAEVFSVLSTAIGVEPLKNDPALLANLQHLYAERLSAIGDALVRNRDARVKQVEQRVGLGLDLPEARTTLEREIRAHAAKIQLLLVGMSTTGMTAQAVNNTFHIGGAVGAIQTGSNANAQVAQTLAGPAQDLGRVLEQIKHALSEHSGLSVDQRSDAIDILDDIERESQKVKPNGSKVGVQLSGVKDTIQTIPAMAPALVQLLAWYETIKAAVS